jgi:hypothetical protein
MRIKTPMNVNPQTFLGYANAVYIVGAIITLLGTFGIVYYSNAASKIKEIQFKQYQKEADVRIAAADLKAADAYRKGSEAQAGAAGANATAETAKAQAETAKAQAEKARAESSAANAEAEKSKTERAALQLRVQELTQSNTQQQQQIAILRENDRPRTISPQQMARIVSVLTGHKGEDVRLQIFAQDNETLSYANQLSEAFTSAGLKVESGIVMGGTGTGLGFSFHANNDQPPLAIAIGNSFRAVGLQYGLQIRPAETAEHTFTIFVGSKPTISN